MQQNSTPLDKIIEHNKMPILFIGSGISKRYLHNSPDWKTLLLESFKVLGDNDGFQYYKIYDEEKRMGHTEFEIFQKIGTIAEQEFNSAFFNKKIKPFKSTKWLKQNISPYKMFISKILKKNKIRSDEILQQEINEFRGLKNKISAVITTNYDTFLENEIFNDDFMVFTKQNQLFSNKSFNMAEIYKIHGCVTDAESIIITENDYRLFKESRKLFIAKMLTLFAESPIIFLGYSLTDENIKLIIEDFLSCLSEDDLKNIEEHFIFINHKKSENDFKFSTKIITGDKRDIHYSVLETDNFLKLFNELNKITPSLPAKKIREVKKVIKDIVDSSIKSKKPESYIIGIDDLDNIDSDKPLAIALGYKDTLVGYSGYKLISTKDIFQDILYDNLDLDKKNMCLNRFKSIPINHLYPVFKYILDTPEYIQNRKLVEYIFQKNTEDKIVSKSFLKSVKNIDVINDFNILKSRIESESTPRKKSQLLLKNMKNISLEQLINLSKLIFEFSSDTWTDPSFKRVVMYIDFKKYYHE